MDAVILLSHGSVLCGSGEALWEHAARLRDSGRYELVEVGYLNYTDPPFLEAVGRCVAEGATRIVVAPYFLAPGKFVRVDVPKAIAEAQALCPNLEFQLAEVVGTDAKLADAILASADASLTSEHWRDDLKRASSHCRAVSQCPLFGTPACPRQPTPFAPTAPIAQSAPIARPTLLEEVG